MPTIVEWIQLSEALVLPKHCRERKEQHKCKQRLVSRFLLNRDIQNLKSSICSLARKEIATIQSWLKAGPSARNILKGTLRQQEADRGLLKTKMSELEVARNNVASNLDCHASLSSGTEG